jgi:hypothetical protein
MDAFITGHAENHKKEYHTNNISDKIYQIMLYISRAPKNAEEAIKKEYNKRGG